MVGMAAVDNPEGVDLKKVACPEGVDPKKVAFLEGVDNPAAESLEVDHWEVADSRPEQNYVLPPKQCYTVSG